MKHINHRTTYTQTSLHAINMGELHQKWPLKYESAYPLSQTLRILSFLSLAVPSLSMYYRIVDLEGTTSVLVSCTVYHHAICTLMRRDVDKEET